MAWNPSPEVAVARDAAKRLGDIAGVNVSRCIVTYTTEDGRVGYASFGATKALCDDAKRLGDAIFDLVCEHAEE